MDGGIGKLLFDRPDWDFTILKRTFDAIERIAREDLGAVMDAAHALMDFGVDRYQRRARPSLKKEQARVAERREQHLADYNDLWARTVPGGTAPAPESDAHEEHDPRAARLGLPEENLLYFLEK